MINTPSIVIFCSLIVWMSMPISSREKNNNGRNDSFKKQSAQMDEKNRSPKAQSENDSSSDESVTDEHKKSEKSPKKHRRTSSNDSIIRAEPNDVFQKVLLPVGGPYCYPEILKSDADVDEDVIQRRRTRYTYSPQLRIESSELMAPVYRKVIEGVWPYEPHQSKRKKEIRKYIKLNVSPYRNEETYRFTGKAAERAFISRYYGFINPSEGKKVDQLIEIIDDKEKAGHRMMIDTGPDPRSDFNEFSNEEKLDFCEKYIDYSVMLYEEKIDFDPTRPERIIRTKAIVQYKYIFLQEFKDILDIIICPCIDTTKTPFELGVLPIRYKYQHPFPYAFIYNILESADTDKSTYTANVRVLTKIDVEGLKSKRSGGILQKLFTPIKHIHRRLSVSDNEEEENKTKQEKYESERIDNKEEGTSHRVLHNLLAPLKNHHHRRHKSSSDDEKINENEN